MTVQEMLDIDYREDKGKKDIQIALRKLKPFSKYSLGKELPLELLEKYLRLVRAKYDIMFNYIVMNTIDGDDSQYSLTYAKNREVVGTIHGICIYELFAKMVLLSHTSIKNGVFKKRE